MNSSKVLLGILGGVAAGALMGVLFAPEKGLKTRKKIVDKSKGFTDDMKGKFERLYENITDKYDNLLADAQAFNAKDEIK